MKKTKAQKEYDVLIADFNLHTAKLKKFFERYEESRKLNPVNGLALPQNEGEE